MEAEHLVLTRPGLTAPPRAVLRRLAEGALDGLRR